LRDACRHSHVPLEQVVSELEQGSEFKPGAAQEVVKGTLGELIEHIVGKHHCSFAEYHPLTMVRLKTLRPPNRSASNPNGILPRLPSSTGMAMAILA